MKTNISEVVKAIALLNNSYRESSASIAEKMRMLWQIGDVLIRMNVTTPHSVGWAIQKETKGLIKRTTIVRAYKVRAIWESRDKLINDLGGIKGLSNFVEMLPLIDPTQEVRRKLSDKQLAEIYLHACSDEPKCFKKYISKIKQKYPHGCLGQAVDKYRHLRNLNTVVSSLQKVIVYLKGIINEKNKLGRVEFRKNIPEHEMVAFSNMCISLTTKENFRFYKKEWPSESLAKNEDIRFLYKFFYDLLSKDRDEERARLRRLVPAEILAQISDIMSSLSSEKDVLDFRERQKIAINL